MLSPRIVMVLLGALAATAPALLAQDKLPDGAKILDEMQKAQSNGHQSPVKSFAITGTCTFRLKTMPNQEPTEGPFSEYFQGGKFFHSSDFKMFGKMEEGVHGETVWQIDPLNGAAILEGEARSLKLRQLGMRLGESWREHYSSTECVGIQEINGVPCYTIDLASEDDELLTWYVGKDDKLTHGMNMEAFTPNGKEEIELRFTDWKDFDGAHEPATMTVDTAFVHIIYRHEQIKYGAEIPAEKLALPSAIQDLLKSDQPNDDTAIKIVELKEQHVASIRAKVKPADIGQTLSVILPEVMGYVTESDATTAGAPFSRYHSFGPTAVDLEGGIPVTKPVTGTDRIKARTLPGGKVAMTWHIGEYHLMGQTYTRVEKWLKEHKIEGGEARWEVYWTDPGREPDPKKWRTQVFWKIK